MKKIIAITALVLFASVGIGFAATIGPTTAGYSLYGGVVAADVAGTNGVLLGKSSKGVQFAANYVTTGYAIVSKHTSGSKGYGTSADSTAVYFIENYTIAQPSASTIDAFVTWTAM